MSMNSKVLKIFILILKIHKLKVPSGKTEDFRLNKIITFVYSTIMDFPDNEFEIKTVVTKAIFSNFRDLIYGGDVIHHSLITEEVIGYAQDFFNKKIRENHSLIPVFAHNLFSFNFFFVLKGIRLVNIGNQVKFIDTIKYYQQSL